MNKKFGAAYVLAGGNSKRMSFDKQTIRIDGKLAAVYIADTLSGIFDDVFIISNSAALYQDCRYIVISDEIESCGPLGGLYTVLCNTSCEFAYVTGCDMPFVNLKYIQYMMELPDKVARGQVDCILTATHGLDEPLNAFYHKRLKDLIPPLLSAGKRRMYDLYNGKNIIYVPEEELKTYDPEYLMFFNMNTMDDYKWYLSNQEDLSGRRSHKVNTRWAFPQARQG